mmetsp:Transcript_50642/g.157053  ORF Transcript_50642/g.157053 Transcript_50642/m.157053 type:complete len:331 (+) Transcript_50642:1697-2689(+)
MDIMLSLTHWMLCPDLSRMLAARMCASRSVSWTSIAVSLSSRTPNTSRVSFQICVLVLKSIHVNHFRSMSRTSTTVSGCSVTWCFQVWRASSCSSIRSENMQRYTRSFTQVFQLSLIAVRCSAAIGSGPQCWQRSRCWRTCFACLGGSILKPTPGVGCREFAEVSRRRVLEEPSRLILASPLDARGVPMRLGAIVVRCDGRGVVQLAALGPESRRSGGPWASCSSARPALCALVYIGVVWRGVAGTIPLAALECAVPRPSEGWRMRLSCRGAGAAAAGAAAGTDAGAGAAVDEAAGICALSIFATLERRALISSAISLTMEDSRMLCSSN